MTAINPQDAQAKGQSWLIFNGYFVFLAGSGYTVDLAGNLTSLEVIVNYNPISHMNSNTVQFWLPTLQSWDFTAGLQLTAVIPIYNDPVLGGPAFASQIGVSYTYQFTDIVLT